MLKLCKGEKEVNWQFTAELIKSNYHNSTYSAHRAKWFSVGLTSVGWTNIVIKVRQCDVR